MFREMNVDHIKKLWTLHLVVREGNLKRAAVKAKVTPSAISQSLASLEKSYGKPLLIRKRGMALPTDEARALLQAVQPAFAIFEDLHSQLNPAKVPAMSWLDFGTYESIAIDILPSLLDRLRSLMPHLQLSMHIDRTSNLLSMIRKGELCTALITECENLERFYVRTVGEDRLGFYMSKSQNKPDWNRVGVLNAGKEGYPRYFTRFLKQLGTTKPILKSDSFETLRACASAGQMIAVLPARVAARQSELVEVFRDGPSSTLGKHKLMLISQSNCDRDEVDFLAVEIAKILTF